MKIRPSFHLREHFPFLGGHDEKGDENDGIYPYDENDVRKTLEKNELLTTPMYDTLLAPQAEQEITSYVLLADSLDKLEHANLLPQDEKIVRDIAEQDAKKFAAGLVPTSVIHDAKIAKDTGWGTEDNAEGRYDLTDYTTPDLKDILLLAEAYDDLGDEELLYVLKFIMEHTSRGEINKDLKAAFDRATSNNTPITSEYHKIIAQTTDRLDSSATDAQKRALDLLRIADKRPIPHLQRQIRNSKANDEDEGRTGDIF